MPAILARSGNEAVSACDRTADRRQEERQCEGAREIDQQQIHDVTFRDQPISGVWAGWN
jgi:hypothetical protein